MKDFNPHDADPIAFAADRFARELCDTDGMISFVADYSEQEIRQSVIQDILTFTMWEIQFEKTIDFTPQQLMAYCSNETCVRVISALNHPDVLALIEYRDQQIRIKDNREIRQAAMDYCGVFFDGYSMPEGVIIVNREAMHEAIDAHGGLDNLVTAMAMDITATHPGNDKIHS